MGGPGPPLKRQRIATSSSSVGPTSANGSLSAADETPINNSTVRRFDQEAQMIDYKI
jgi:hypothetical protein